MLNTIAQTQKDIAMEQLKYVTCLKELAQIPMNLAILVNLFKKTAWLLWPGFTEQFNQ